MAFDQVDILRLPAGLAVGGTHGPQLPFRHGGEQAAADIIGKTDAADDAVDPVAVGNGVFGPLEQEDAGSFTDDQTISGSIER